MSVEAEHTESRALALIIMTVFLRVLSVLFIYRGLLAWTVLIGLNPFGGTPFADLSVEIQVSTVVLSILAPVAAVGLWLEASWGPVLWIIIAIAELIMHVAFTQYFGTAWELVAMHIVLLIIFAVLYFFVRRVIARERLRRKPIG